MQYGGAGREYGGGGRIRQRGDRREGKKSMRMGPFLHAPP